jgi:hypothetical protein
VVIVLLLAHVTKTKNAPVAKVCGESKREYTIYPHTPVLVLTLFNKEGDNMSVTGGSARKQTLPTGRILSIVLILFLTAINFLCSKGLILSSSSSSSSSSHSWILDPDHVQQLLGNFSIHIRWHPKKRSERFPSVDERVKLYMSNWYLPPCRNTNYTASSSSIGTFAGKYSTRISTIQSNDGRNESWPILYISDPMDSVSNNKSMIIDSSVHPDRNILLHRATIEDCARSKEEYNQQGKLFTESRVNKRWFMFSYCSEVVELMNLMDQMDRDEVDDEDGDTTTTPILAYFGDGTGLISNDQDAFEIPLIAKYRAATTKEYISQVTTTTTGGGGGSNYLREEESCWKQEQQARPPLKTVYHQDEYRNKLSPIIWRLNPNRHWNPLPEALQKDTAWEEKKNVAFYSGDMTGSYNSGSKTTDLETCVSNQRCRFVLMHGSSKLIDARIAFHLGRLKHNTVNGTQIVKKKVGVDIIQQYKVLICLEGNDVSSGLKWMLQSQSVVLMPPPTRTSWAMEELLEPWIHYIPMLSNGTNAETMVQWVLDNDKEARRIAERATLFMYDLVYHSQAASDDRKIKENIARRYRALWH